MSAARDTSTPATLVEPGTVFEGLVSFRGAVRIEGTIIGRVIATGTLVIGPRGELRGRVEADDVLVEGLCEGEIAARQLVELRPTARVEGHITAPRVAVADGSVFDGTWQVGRQRPAESAPPPRPRPDPERTLGLGELSLPA